MPNFGQMAFSAEGELEFAAHDVVNDQVDMWITTSAADSVHAAGDIMRQYVDAVGHAPMAPDWLVGYWHSLPEQIRHVL